MHEPGSIKDYNDVKLLALFILDQLKISIPRQALLDTMTAEALANFFDAASAVSDLLSLGLIEESLEEEKALLSLTPEGLETLHTLSKKLKYSVRERALKAAHSALRQQSLREYVVAEYYTVKNGFLVDLAFFEREDEPFSLRLTVPSQDMAADICNRFREHAPDLVLSLSELLLKGPGAK